MTRAEGTENNCAVEEDHCAEGSRVVYVYRMYYRELCFPGISTKDIFLESPTRKRTKIFKLTPPLSPLIELSGTTSHIETSTRRKGGGLGMPNITDIMLLNYLCYDMQAV